MIQILIGSFFLSVIHASVPNHWIPLVVVSKAEKWSRTETFWVTTITGSAHTISTILVGIVVGLLGYKLSSTHEYVTRLVAPLILVIMGIVYLVMGVKHPHQHRNPVEIESTSNKSKFMIIISLGIGMFFSPCIEIEAYYFTAGILGWHGIAIVSTVYLSVTVLGMLLLVDLGRKGAEKIEWHFLEKHEKKIMGVVLILLGVFAYFIEM
jgi:cadmium resistance protein CadD (predicted permease)